MDLPHNAEAWRDEFQVAKTSHSQDRLYRFFISIWAQTTRTLRRSEDLLTDLVITMRIDSGSADAADRSSPLITVTNEDMLYPARRLLREQVRTESNFRNRECRVALVRAATQTMVCGPLTGAPEEDLLRRSDLCRFLEDQRADRYPEDLSKFLI